MIIITDFKPISDMTEGELLSDGFLAYVFDTKDEVVKIRLLEAIKQRAKLLGCLTKANALIKATAKELLKEKCLFDYGFHLERTAEGGVKPSIYNFEQIIRNDSYFAALAYNTLSGKIVKNELEGEVSWSDNDDTLAYSYVYENYKIYAPQVFLQALNNVALSRSFNPVRERIETITWDGKERLGGFLTFALGCENTLYVREVSRLIFAGGIHRIYSPGCKFDSVPVLVGSQGGGKSTLVRWLAMEDSFYSEVFTVEDKDGMECIRGKWVCELSELIAVTGAKEVEGVKAFLSRQSDYYRRPYDRRADDYKRSCFFIGTTNRQQFLTDKTGNRRYLPVTVKSNGRDLFAREKEIKEYIAQCWAEGYFLYKKGLLPTVSDVTLSEEIFARQESATEYDYRTDVIREYLKGRTRVCVLQLWQQALGEKYSRPSRRDSAELGLIMQQMKGWVTSNSTLYFEGYGRHRGWICEKNG